MSAHPALLKTASLFALKETHGKVREFMESMYLNEYELDISKRSQVFLQEIEGELARRVLAGDLVEAEKKP